MNLKLCFPRWNLSWINTVILLSWQDPLDFIVEFTYWKQKDISNLKNHFKIIVHSFSSSFKTLSTNFSRMCKVFRYLNRAATRADDRVTKLIGVDNHVNLELIFKLFFFKSIFLQGGPTTLAKVVKTQKVPYCFGQHHHFYSIMTSD